MNNKPVVLTGLQPTNDLHLGNYLGVIKPNLDKQDAQYNIFLIADLHSRTTQSDEDAIAQNTESLIRTLLACGLDPKKSSIVVQSRIPEHLQLFWELSCLTTVQQLQRMTQFKEKSREGQPSSLGLLSYPVLQAADILLYGPDRVSVGRDQAQHLELTRAIARKTGRKIPQANISPITVMSLGDGTKKMSKSDPKSTNTIFLSDTPEDIAAKIKKAKTDSYDTLTSEDPQRPECRNLLSILGELRGEPVNTNGLSYSQLKAQLIVEIQDELRGIAQAQAKCYGVNLGIFVDPSLNIVKQKITLYRSRNNEK